MNRVLSFFVSSISLFLFGSLANSLAFAQTDIHISGAKAGFPIAVPLLCDAGGAGQSARTISDVISKDLKISGLFKVLNPSTFVETPGKCADSNAVAYSDWSVIGAEGLVRGVINQSGNTLSVQMFLHDVLQQKPVVGKKYEGTISDAPKIAHRFSNEIMRYFTGESGIFGTKISYISRVGRFKELFVMDMDGSNVRQLTNDRALALSPSWSPSADRIVFTSYRSRKPDLYITTPEGGGVQRITNRKGLELGAEFSPDGSRLVASASINGISKIVNFSLSGRLTNKLTSSGSIDVSPTWSPDGSQVAFCSNRGGGPQIYVMPASGGRAKRISYTNSSYCTSPSWSPKGDKIAFTCRSGGNQVFVSDPSGSNASQLTSGGNNEDPSWSPDGRFLAFSSNFGRRGPRNIGVLSLLGGAPRQVTFSKSEDSQPAWSPRLGN